MRPPEVIAAGFSLLEGPRWHGDRLYVSDFFTHRVLAFRPDGSYEDVCTVAGQPSGLGFGADGHLLVVSMLDQKLLRVAGSTLTEIADLSPVMTGPANDMVVSSDGVAYIGNFGVELGERSYRPTTLVRVDPDGSVSVAAEELIFPNGAVITPDGTRLILAETFASRLTEFDIAADGSLRDRRIWADFSGVGAAQILPDGLAFDEEGLIWVADAGGHGALRVGRGGAVRDRIDTGDLAVYAVALGGPSRRTLFMCAAPPLGTSDPATARRAVLISCDVDVPSPLPRVSSSGSRIPETRSHGLFLTMGKCGLTGKTR